MCMEKKTWLTYFMYSLFLDEGYASMKKQLGLLLKETSYIGGNWIKSSFNPVIWILKSTAPFKAHVFAILSDRVICMAFQILSEAPNTEGPQEKWSQGSASVYILYFPFQFPALHTPSLCLLCCVPPAATETLYFVFSGAFFTAGSLRPNFLLFLLPSLFFFSSLLLMNVDDIDFPTTELHLSQDYRLQGAREALHSQRIQIYPTCSAVMPGNQAKFFFSLQEEALSTQHAGTAPNQQRQIFLIFALWWWSFGVHLPQFDLYPRCKDLQS